ncbi:hypothetical protein B0H21DRAFT_735292 [Amylocystis lapponica]|nr:hypothetical protein B0H21DRAFT_735292 [Amylocystis lapponica]
MSAVASLTVVTSEVPLVPGDVLRSTGKPAVEPSGTSSGRSSSNSNHSLAETLGVDLNVIGKSEARKIMSEEHRILGFRPPHGSLAAEAQAAAAKHPEGIVEADKPDVQKLKALAREDAERILRVQTVPKSVSPTTAEGGVNLSTISATEARTLMSHEHRALGFRPPPGSLAAEAQAAAAKHPDGDGPTVDEGFLKQIALRDAEKIKADREVNVVGEINTSTLGEAGAATLVDAAERTLDGPAPDEPGSLLSEAKAEAAAHPADGSFPPLSDDPVRLAEVGAEEGARLKEAAEGAPDGAWARAEADVQRGRRPWRLSDVLRSATDESVEIVGDVYARLPGSLAGRAAV